MQSYTESDILEYQPTLPLHFYETVGSTNDEAKKSAANGAKHGTLFVAQRQINGQGRKQRNFESPLGGIYASVVLRPKAGEIYAPGLITAGAAVAVHRAVQALCGRSLGIKWVNDLLWRNKKCCGILTLAGWQDATPSYYIVGIGLNYTDETGSFAEGSAVGDIATALYKSGGQPVAHARLLVEIYNQFLRIFAQLPKTDFLATYRENSILLGRQITVLSGQPYTATAKSVDDEAQLVVVLQSGEETTLNSGEVSVVMAEKS